MATINLNALTGSRYIMQEPERAALGSDVRVYRYLLSDQSHEAVSSCCPNYY